MYLPWRIVLLLGGSLLFLTACGERPTSPQPLSTPLPPSLSGEKVSVQILPENPTANDCLQVIIKGQPSGPQIAWHVNGQPVVSREIGKLCAGALRRGDQVMVMVGAAETASTATVTIGNSPPKVTGISATPKQLFAGMDVEVFPLGEDRDGDPVEFRYQWLINSEAIPFLTEAKLPGDRFVKGDRLQVRITPFDGQEEGPVYLSYVMPVPNAPPRITSQPPQNFEALEYRYQVATSDPDGDQLIYRLTQAPAGMTVSPSGLIIWPLTGVQPGVHPMKIIVSDPEGAEAFQEFNLTLGTPSQVEGRMKPQIEGAQFIAPGRDESRP